MKTGNLFCRFLDVSAYFLIPFLTVAFAGESDWFTTNFSVLGSAAPKQNVFAFWGLLVGVYFFTILEVMIRYLAPRPRGTFFVPLSLLLLTCAVTTPYLPDRFPFKSFLHVVCAFLAAVCLAAFLILLTLNLHRKAPAQFQRYQAGLALILLGSVLLLFAAGIVSSALEIFFTISAALFCRRLERKLSVIYGR